MCTWGQGALASRQPPVMWRQPLIPQAAPAARPLQGHTAAVFSAASPLISSGSVFLPAVPHGKGWEGWHWALGVTCLPGDSLSCPLSHPALGPRHPEHLPGRSRGCCPGVTSLWRGRCRVCGGDRAVATAGWPPSPTQVQAQILLSSAPRRAAGRELLSLPKVAAICTVIKSPEDDK